MQAGDIGIKEQELSGQSYSEAGLGEEEAWGFCWLLRGENTMQRLGLDTRPEP